MGQSSDRKQSRPLRSRLRRNLFVGLAVFLPLVLLALVVYSLAIAVVRLIVRLDGVLAAVGIEGPLATGLAISGAFLSVLLLLILVGTTARHRYGQLAVDTVDNAIERIPGLGPIYAELSRSRQVFSGEGPSSFRKVVSVELAPGVEILAFVVGEQHDWAPATTDSDVTVYAPIAPNPLMGGHLLSVRRDHVSETDLSVRGALATLVTMGTNEGVAEPPLSALYHDAGDAAEQSSETTESEC